MKKFLVVGTFLFSSILYADTSYQQTFYDKIWKEIATKPSDDRPKIALVLGGGGARGSAHIGVLKVFEEENIPIDIITGTSVGAFIGSLYASGKTPKEIIGITNKLKWSDFVSLNFVSFIKLLFKDVLLDTTKMSTLISKNIENKKFHELNIPFACVATDIVTGEKVILRDGDVAIAVRASNSIPGLFKPVEYKQRYLVDGGIVDNVPIDVAKAMGADIIIAVNIEADFTQNELKKVINMLFQITYIQGKRLNAHIIKDADFILSPDVSHTDVIDLKSRDLVLDEGRKEARKNIQKIKQLIIKRVYGEINV